MDSTIFAPRLHPYRCFTPLAARLRGEFLAKWRPGPGDIIADGEPEVPAAVTALESMAFAIDTFAALYATAEQREQLGCLFGLLLGEDYGRGLL